MTPPTMEQVKARAEADARTYGYHLTPDPQLLQGLLEGLKTNEERYGYPSCPCRLAIGNLEIDRDIICPCDYRDPDMVEYGACYCRLYVNQKISESKELPTVPERRPMEKQSRTFTAAPETEKPTQQTETAPPASPDVKKKMWYCSQCGYVVFREDPPYICPICKAKREMFKEIKTKIDFSG